MREVDRAATKLSARQHGAFAWWQLEAAGVAMRSCKVRLASGTWVRVAPGVYVLPGTADTFERRLWIGWLAAGAHALVSHEAAAHVLDVPNVIRDRVTLIVPHSGYHRIRNVTVHQISDVRPEHVTVVDGLPTTTVPRTIVDLAAVVSTVRLRTIVEDSKFARLATPESVGECLLSVARRGKPGVRSLAKVLATFTDGRAASQSRLEDGLIDVIRLAGLPAAKPQFPFPGRQFVKGCVDFAYPEVKLIVEADGRAWHTRIREVARDAERDGEAAEHGWLTLRLFYEHIVGDPEGTARRLRAVFEQRLLQLAS